MEPVIVTDRQGAEALLNRSKPWRFLPMAQVKLQLPALSAEESQRLEGQINRYADACGCEESGVFVIVALGGYAIYVFAYGAHSITSVVWHFVVGFFVAGLIGKLTGLFRARLRLRTYLSYLVSRSM